MNTDTKVVCSGKTAFPIIMGVFFVIEGIAFIVLLLCFGTTFGVQLIGALFSLFCITEGVSYILFWCNRSITISSDKIIYRSNWGKERTYSWQDVKSVCYKSSGRGSVRILIQTDKKIYLFGDMTNFEEAEKLLKEKGYLDPLKKY